MLIQIKKFEKASNCIVKRKTQILYLIIFCLLHLSKMKKNLIVQSTENIEGFIDQVKFFHDVYLRLATFRETLSSSGKVNGVRFTKNILCIGFTR